VTLRYDNHGRPVGLDWKVCNDGNPRPEIWSNWQAPKKRRNRSRKPIMNPGIGRGGAKRFSPEKDALIVKMYVEDQMPAYKIAEVINSTPKTIWRVLKRNKVQKRTGSSAQKLRYQFRRRAS
jgi:hypothetical protein